MADAKQFQVAGTSYDIKDVVARGRVGDVEALIPAEATAQNKLADKEYVNSGIATATATYRGGYNLVSDLQLTTAATESQVTTALVAKMTDLSITPDNNDYCFVQIPTDDSKPTEIARVDRYKFNGTVWGFEFSVNNSGFTAAQWAALNSGITNGQVAKLSDLPTNTELTEALGGKVDKVSGKGLSTNDYTTEEKTKLGALPTNADLTTALANKADKSELSVFDISVYNNNATYADLAAALGTNGANVPESVRKGGMSVKYVQSSDNKYVHYRYTNTDAATNSKFVNVDNWNEDNGEVWVDNSEWIRVVTDKDGNILAGIKGDGSIEWSVGVPMPVKEHVALLLEGKVDKEEGKSLIGSDIANGIGYEESPEWIKVEVDDEYNVLNGIHADGSHYARNMHSETIDKNAEDIVTLNNKIEGMRAGNVKYDIIFASYDSSDYDKSIADHVCTETNAQEVIQNAIDDWYANNEFNSGCFLFCAGTYIMTHFIEPDPTGDDKNGTPYCIVMPRGKVANQSPNSMAHYPTYCSFEGVYESQMTATLFKLSPDAYLLKSNGDIESLDDYTDDSSIYMQETTISGVTYPARYLVDNKRYSLVRCVSDPTNPGASMWCSYTMRLANMKLRVGGSAEDRRLTQYPIVMIDGLYASAIDLENVAVSVATGIFEKSNDGAQHFNVGFTGIRCNQGQSRGTQQHMLNVSVSGYYHGIELGSEHWLIQDTVVLQCCMGLAFGCYHDTYGSGHASTFDTIALERNYYPMYFYYNKQFDNLSWVTMGNLVVTGLATEWVLYAYGQDEPETNGCHVEHFSNAPKGTIYCERPTNTQLFDEQSSSLLFYVQIICNNLMRCHLWSNIYGSPAVEHGIKSLVGEHGQIVFLTDKKCFVIWNNYNNNGPTNRGYWERLDGSAVEQN